MNTKLTYNFIALCAWLMVMAMTTACQKKCPRSTNERATTVAKIAWRMVETTDKNANFRTLSVYSFDVWSFSEDFVGQVNEVKNNRKFDDAKCTFKYKAVDGILAMEWKAGSTVDGEGNSTSLKCPFSGAKFFEYSLGRELELVDQKTGAYYRFVQGDEIILPDMQCTF